MAEQQQFREIPKHVWERMGHSARAYFSGKTQSEWPIWAKALRQFAKPEDKGIGDVVARMIGDYNSATFKSWYRATFGKDCGCAGRQAKWNRQYPLEHEAAA